MRSTGITFPTMKCDVNVCKAACCYNVPMNKSYLSVYRKKIVNPVIRVETMGDKVVPITNNDLGKNKCPFLTEKCKCNIYKSRPDVCVKFGTGDGFLNCTYLTGIPIDESKIKKLLYGLN